MSGAYQYTRPVYSFHPHTFSFDIDNNDEKLKLTLRRASLTGLTPHPISRQLSDKVEIPVEHCEEETPSSVFHASTERQSQTKRITLPEYPQLDNNAKRSENTRGVEKKPKKFSSKVPTSVKVQRVPDKTRSKLHASLGDKVTLPWKSRSKDPKYDPKKYAEHQAIDDAFLPGDTVTGEKTTNSIEKTLKKLELKRANESLVKEESDKQKMRKENEKEIKKQDEFMKKGYKLHRFLIIPDGNCVYRAIAQAVLLDQSQHMVLRQLAIEHIQQHKEEFKNIIEEDIEVFLKTAQLEGHWGGYAEILALTRLLDINIMITTGGTSSNPNVQTRLHYFENEKDKSEKTKSTADNKKGGIKYIDRQSIWLSWLSSGHYDTFVEEKIENPCYDEWLASRESRIKSDAKIANQLYSDDLNRQELRNFMQDETEFQNRIENTTDSQSYINDNFSDDLYGLEYVLPPQQYPPSTYPRRAAHQNTSSRYSPPSSYSSLNSSTEFDEEIALSLWDDEKRNSSGFLA